MSLCKSYNYEKIIAACMLLSPAYTKAAVMGAHIVLDPAGPQASHIAQLWYLTVGICGVVFAAIIIATLYAILHRRDSRDEQLDQGSQLDQRSQLNQGLNESAQNLALDLSPKQERLYLGYVIGAVALSTVLLIFLIVASVFTDRALAKIPVKDAEHIEIVAHQWWWEAKYDNNDINKIFTTANEIHVPVDRPVLLTLKAADVIHSFWVPNLGGKKDLIPGRSTKLLIQANRAGQYRGQCAEFCGFQHALMGFKVTADPAQDYEAWLQSQRQTANEPLEPKAVRGKTVFMTNSCAMCHAIQGTPALANNAPDLTHIASRSSLAAGTLKNTKSNLKHWIKDPQSVKPGTNMPPTALPEPDLDALVAYLGGLK